MSNLIGKIQGTVKEGKSCIKLNSDIVDINGLEITSDGIFGGFTKGMVVQVKHKDYKKTVDKDSTGWTAIDNNLETGFVVAIKPSSSASNVLVSCTLHVSIYTPANQHYWGARLYRKIGNGDWTHLSEADGEQTDGTPIWLTDTLHNDSAPAQNRLMNLGNKFLDSPNTTETVYYTIYWANIYQDNFTRLLHLNRASTDNTTSSDDWHALPISNITAQEIWNSGTVYRPDNNLITLHQSDNNVDISGTLNVQGEKVMTVPALDICGNDLSANTTYEITTGPPGSINNISFVKKQPEYILSAAKNGDQDLSHFTPVNLKGFQVAAQKNSGFNVGDVLASSAEDFVWQCPANGLYHIIVEAMFDSHSHVNTLEFAKIRILPSGGASSREAQMYSHQGDNDDFRMLSVNCSIILNLSTNDQVNFQVQVLLSTSATNAGIFRGDNGNGIKHSMIHFIRVG